MLTFDLAVKGFPIQLEKVVGIDLVVGILLIINSFVKFSNLRQTTYDEIKRKILFISRFHFSKSIKYFIMFQKDFENI